MTYTHDTPEHMSIEMSDDQNVLDENTLRYVYKRLKGSHPKAALYVGDLIINPPVTPDVWAEQNAHRYTQKIEFIKAIRSEFDCLLKDAKVIADEYF